MYTDKLASPLDNRFLLSLPSKDAHFVEDVYTDITEFQEQKDTYRVLVFPPLNSYQRLLIHKLVDSELSDLITFSIGVQDSRRTVVAFREACVRGEKGRELLSKPAEPSSESRKTSRWNSLPSNERVSNWVKQREARHLNRQRWAKRSINDADSVDCRDSVDEVENTASSHPQAMDRSKIKKQAAAIYRPPSMRQRQNGEMADSPVSTPTRMEESPEVGSKTVEANSLGGMRKESDPSSQERKTPRGRGRGRRKPEAEVYVPRALRPKPMDSKSSAEEVGVDLGKQNLSSSSSMNEEKAESKRCAFVNDIDGQSAQVVTEVTGDERTEIERTPTHQPDDSTIFADAELTSHTHGSQSLCEGNASDPTDIDSRLSQSHSHSRPFPHAPSEQTPSATLPDDDTVESSDKINCAENRVVRDVDTVAHSALSASDDPAVVLSSPSPTEELTEEGASLDFPTAESTVTTAAADFCAQETCKQTDGHENLSTRTRSSSSNDECCTNSPSDEAQSVVESITDAGVNLRTQSDEGKAINSDIPMSGDVHVESESSVRVRDEEEKEGEDEIMKHSESKGDETEHSESKGGKTKHSESEGDKTKHSEVKHDIMKHSESKGDEESKGVKAKHSDSKGDKTKHSKSKGERTKHSVSKGDKTKHSVSKGDKTKHSESKSTDVETKHSDVKVNRMRASSDSKPSSGDLPESPVRDENNATGDEEVEDSWDTMFDDDGDCLDDSMVEELTDFVGKVEVDKPKIINYLNYTPKEPDYSSDMHAFGHIVEIYDFPAELATHDLITAFRDFSSRGFDIKWVDDTHALGVFSSVIAAKEALKMSHLMFKVRSMSEASKKGQSKAKNCSEFLQPYKARPQTTSMAARRLVAGALGMAPQVSREVRDQERQKLKDAKEKRRRDKQQKVDIWDGSFGGCAMDAEGDA